MSDIAYNTYQNICIVGWSADLYTWSYSVLARRSSKSIATYAPDTNRCSSFALNIRSHCGSIKSLSPPRNAALCALIYAFNL